MNINYNSAVNDKSFFWIDAKKILIFIGLMCLVISLFQISFFTSETDIRGFWVLIMGWIGLFFFQFAWFANPLNLLALLVLANKPKTSLFLSLLAIGFAAHSIQLTELPIDLKDGKIYIKELGLGFYFWFIAQVLFFTVVLFENIYKHKA